MHNVFSMQIHNLQDKIVWVIDLKWKHNLTIFVKKKYTSVVNSTISLECEIDPK